MDGFSAKDRAFGMKDLCRSGSLFWFHFFDWMFFWIKNLTELFGLHLRGGRLGGLDGQEASP